MQKRKYTRSVVWPNTEATIKVQDSFSDMKKKNVKIKGEIENLGCNGMFVITNESIPVPATAEITINFDSESNMPDMLMTASGKTVRLTKKGVGIRFTTIDLSKLQKCIIQKINNSDISECDADKYLLLESEK